MSHITQRQLQRLWGYRTRIGRVLSTCDSAMSHQNTTAAVARASRPCEMRMQPRSWPGRPCHESYRQGATSVMAEEGGARLQPCRLLIRVQLEMRVKFFQTLPSGACQQPARERLGKIVFQRDDIQNRSDRFRDIRGIRGP